jgi:LysM repeat protein
VANACLGYGCSTMSQPDVKLVGMKAHPKSVYRRRRLAVASVAAALLVVLAMGAVALVSWLGDGLHGASGSARAGADTRVPEVLVPVSQEVYVVRPGDTLWSIARALQPTGDVRPLVHRLSRARRGAPLRPGEPISLP